MTQSTDAGWPAGLLPEHVAYLAARGVTPAVAKARGYISLRAGRARKQPESETGAMPFSNPLKLGMAGGLGIPLHPLLSPDADAWQIRVPDDAVTDKQRKFRTPAGQKNCLVTHPATLAGVTAEAQPLWIPEGVTRVDALARYDYPAAGITGCWNWRTKSGPLPDFEVLPIDGRSVIIAMDGDLQTNAKVYRAAARLSAYLEAKGATVFVLVLPNGQGLDDFLAHHQPVDRAAADALLQPLLTPMDQVTAPKGAARQAIYHGDEMAMTDRMQDLLAAHVSEQPPESRWYRTGRDGDYYLSRPAGTSIKPVSASHVREASYRLAAWLRREGESVKEAKPDRDVLRTLAEVPDDRLDILSRVTDMPQLESAGLQETTGYEAATQTLRIVADEYDPDMTLTDALAELMDAFGEFPFAGPADYANMLGVMLTPMIGAHTGRGPGLMVDAPTPGTGKSLLATCCGIITSGGNPKRLQLPNERDDTTETPKRLASALEAGRAILLDNLSGVVNSPTLAEYMTEGEWSTRRLGFSDQQQVFDTRAQVTLATANNAMVSTELADRFLNCRLDRGVPDPRNAGIAFRHENLVTHVTDNRMTLVSALAALVRAWVDAGRPTSARPAALGSFDAWRNCVSDILAHGGIDGFATNVQAFSKRAVGSDDPTAFLRAWWAAHEDMVVGAAELFAVAGLDGDDPLLDLRGNSERALRTALGRHLPKLVDRVCGLEDGSLIKVAAAGSYKRAQNYRLVKSHQPVAPYRPWPCAGCGDPIESDDDVIQHAGCV